MKDMWEMFKETLAPEQRMTYEVIMRTQLALDEADKAHKAVEGVTSTIDTLDHEIAVLRADLTAVLSTTGARINKMAEAFKVLDARISDGAEYTCNITEGQQLMAKRLTDVEDLVLKMLEAPAPEPVAEEPVEEKPIVPIPQPRVEVEVRPNGNGKRTRTYAIKHCEHCGDEFAPKSNSQRVCEKGECRRWVKNHPRKKYRQRRA